MDIVQGDDYEKPVKPEYINLVREKKQPGQENDINSKEKLLAEILVCTSLSTKNTYILRHKNNT